MNKTKRYGTARWLLVTVLALCLFYVSYLWADEINRGRTIHPNSIAGGPVLWL
jgi:hypothetical protein